VTAELEIIPAIDLKAGQCVRLYQGDFGMSTVYSLDPLAVAINWQTEGAKRLHVVDLDGASSGKPRNYDLVGSIVQRLSIPVQVGGGIRELEVARQLMDIGVDRIVLGTTAIQNIDMVKYLCSEYDPNRIIVALDARNGFIAINGWKEETSISVRELIDQMLDVGVVRFLYTDILRDGTLTEPNFPAIMDLVSTKYHIVASGGISEIAHLGHLLRIGVEGAVIGKALYTGGIDLKQALSASK
jgi:phosphoribosylformimino-5-aminoimidazole carboxamide ribotide isomerase